MRVVATYTDDVSLLDKAERSAWWQQCKLKYSSMNCFIDYIPQGIEGSDEDDDIIEREHIKTKLAARGITLKYTDEKDDTEHEIAYRKPKFELFDPWWLDNDDKEGRELAENFSRDHRKEMNAKWAAKHGSEEEEDEEETDEE